ncbi:ras guanyl-nucleotide exchange factor [Lasiosphaeria ovina]|uniref:Ras guanyl-nucleotide exchange factor n=1 Tax=Lasiosphaeria ovina TaxID=92902 RepID=A0AAE0NM07_9PEZI|nr:ras guanyl-nucleotide exchange factor [Lasiosphaeria ovina]
MASTAPQPAKLRALYRSLFRELPPRPILSSPPSPLHQRLRDSFRTPPSPSPSTTNSTPTKPSTVATTWPSADAAAVAHAEQYLAYLRAQRTYAALLERYNPGMGMDEEERVRLSARRIGIDLPTLYDADADAEGGDKEGGRKK